MGTDLLAGLQELLLGAQGREDDKQIRDWRIHLQRSRWLTLGIKNNMAGSVYTPPAYKHAESAEILVVWADGKCSKAKVQKASWEGLLRPEKILSTWRLSAYEDPDATSIPESKPLPQVQLTDEAVRQILTDEQRKIFEYQEQILSQKPSKAQTNAQIMCLWGNPCLTTSTGIQAEYEESRYSLSWSFDSQVGEVFASRRLPTRQEFQELWQRSLLYHRILQEPSARIHPGSRVILAPSVLGQMISQFLLPQFKGENILEGQSRFTSEDFAQGKKVIASGLQVEINPLASQQWESYLITAEGVPATRTTLIADGMLRSPILNAKDAKRWGVSPTALPAGSSAVIVKADRETSWEYLLKGIEDGVLVLSVLGLHTQNPYTGNFSLAAPSSLRIEGGRLTGKVDVRINGNIWDILAEEQTQYGLSPMDKHPYLVTHAKAENL